jgi:hypothetical protein
MNYAVYAGGGDDDDDDHDDDDNGDNECNLPNATHIPATKTVVHRA